jgi:hypothetical protein
MCHNGLEIKSLVLFSNLILILSRSRLFFGSNSFNILSSDEGDVSPSSSSGGFGFVGLKSSGSKEVRLTASEISKPI